MSMIEEAADLPRLDASMIEKPVAQCARCGKDLHSRSYGPRPTGEQAFGVRVFEFVPACLPCMAVMEREMEMTKNRDFAADMDASVEKVRGHLAEIETIIRSQPSSISMMQAMGTEQDWAALCHGLLMCRYLAKRFSAAAIVEADIAAGGTGAGNAPRVQKAPSP